MSTQTAGKNAQLSFDFIPGVSVVLRPAAGELTSDAGLLALRQFDERVGWTAKFAACLRDDRDGPEHSLLSMIRQRVYGIIAGYEDCNDHDTLRDDLVFKMIAGKLPEDGPLASQPTLSRLENAASVPGLLALADLMLELGVQRVRAAHGGKAPERVTIDLDPTDDPTHGAQQLTFFHGFYDQHQYYPMIVSEETTKHVFVAWLRHGTCPAALGADDNVRDIARALRKANPDTRLLVRGDANIGNPAMYQLCENEGHDYVFGLGTNSKLKGWAEPLVRRAAREHARTGVKQRLFAFRFYKAGSWDRRRVVIAKAECSAEGTNLRFILTSLEVKSENKAREVYNLYVQRGESEQRMDELKNGLGAGRLSCRRFKANFLRLMLHTLAFNLLNALRGHEDVPQELRRARPETWRSRIIKVAARVVRTTRRIVLELSEAWPFWPLLERLGRRALIARAAGP